MNPAIFKDGVTDPKNWEMAFFGKDVSTIRHLSFVRGVEDEITSMNPETYKYIFSYVLRGGPISPGFARSVSCLEFEAMASNLIEDTLYVITNRLECKVIAAGRWKEVMRYYNLLTKILKGYIVHYGKYCALGCAISAIQYLPGNQLFSDDDALLIFQQYMRSEPISEFFKNIAYELLGVEELQEDKWGATQNEKQFLEMFCDGSGVWRICETLTLERYEYERIFRSSTAKLFKIGQEWYQLRNE